jgi:hypothetical protein
VFLAASLPKAQLRYRLSHRFCYFTRDPMPTAPKTLPARRSTKPAGDLNRNEFSTRLAKDRKSYHKLKQILIFFFAQES